MTVNEAMLIIAEREAKRNGYIEVSRYNINAKNDKFWGNRMIGYDSKDPVIIKACKYIIPTWEEEEKSVPMIRIDMNWGLPRLTLYYPDKSMVCLTYKDNICSEAQAFGENGLKLALSIKEQIDYLIKE